MLVRVKTRFIDRLTGRTMEAGEEYDIADRSRVEKLTLFGFVEPAAEHEEKSAVAPAQPMTEKKPETAKKAPSRSRKKKENEAGE